MYENFDQAGRGMKTMFIAEILVLLSIIPVVGLFTAIAGFILNLVGLSTAKPAHPNFQNAWYAAMAGIALSVVAIFAGDGFFGSIVSILSSIVSLALVYFVCSAGADLVEARGDSILAERGRFVWKLTVVCTAVAVVCTLAMFVPLLNILAAVAAVGAAIASLVAGILYIVFLYNASRYLLD